MSIFGKRKKENEISGINELDVRINEIEKRVDERRDYNNEIINRINEVD